MDFNEETATNNVKTWAFYKAGTSGSFATALCSAFEKADLRNRQRLREAFPLLFKTADEWFVSDDPDAYLKEILKK